MDPVDAFRGGVIRSSGFLQNFMLTVWFFKGNLTGISVIKLIISRLSFFSRDFLIELDLQFEEQWGLCLTNLFSRSG